MEEVHASQPLRDDVFHMVIADADIVGMIVIATIGVLSLVTAAKLAAFLMVTILCIMTSTVRTATVSTEMVPVTLLTEAWTVLMTTEMITASVTLMVMETFLITCMTTTTMDGHVAPTQCTYTSESVIMYEAPSQPRQKFIKRILLPCSHQHPEMHRSIILAPTLTAAT